MVRLERFERPTYGFVVRCSIQLSYKRIGISFITYPSEYFNLFFAYFQGYRPVDMILSYHYWSIFGYSGIVTYVIRFFKVYYGLLYTGNQRNGYQTGTGKIEGTSQEPLVEKPTCLGTLPLL